VGSADAGQPQVGVKVALGEGSAVSTGLSVLDHLLGELARAARIQLALEAAPGAVDQAVAGAGRGMGEQIAPLLRAPGATGHGFAWLPAGEALAGAVIEVSERPLVASNADFSGVGGLRSDVVAVFLEELARGAGQNVLSAIFKALGAAIGQACRTPEGGAP
jgi:imidazoleglycerol phosphate dehydratase HisB